MEIQLTIKPLCNVQERNALAFLSARPVHTAYLRGLIRDHGISSSCNRGDFYACLNEQGEFEGVALFGHATLIEAKTDRVVECFADFAQRLALPRLVRGERRIVNGFWQRYGQRAFLQHRINSELLLVQREAVKDIEALPELRVADEADLLLLTDVNASLIREEGGINPLEHDPNGFKKRLAARIQKGRIWILTEGQRVVFKMDVLADTPEAVYIEGVYVAPEMRGRGFGARCLAQLGRRLLKRTSAVCLTVNESNHAARSLYCRLGYETQCEYATIYLSQTRGAAVV